MMFLHSCSLAVRCSCFRKPRITIRPFSSSWTARKDATENALNLDVWKSVMRSQALQEESKSPNQSTLEANRELVEMWHQAGKSVPKNITDEQLEALTELTTKSAKNKYLKFLTIKESYKITKKEKQERRKSEREADGEFNQEEPKNSFLLKIWSSSMDCLHSWRVAQAMHFGQPLVYDMSYDQHMSRREMENTVAQLMESEGWNRRAADPFHLHFCGLQPDSAYHRELLNRYGSHTWDQLLITATERSHVELFPQQDLVYLTADSQHVLHTFDHSKVYIIGAMVDRSIHSGVSLANAKRLKLATARLPMDEYLDWDCGAKNLTLDQMIRILSTWKDTGSWQKALEFVPKRKHSGFHQQSRGVTRTTKSRFIRNDSSEIHIPALVQSHRKNKTDGHKKTRTKKMVGGS
ncbi:tRNA methyltransferase 10 homolog C [Sinocyclocheilus anshuiensis]|uniref:tRNA methyltransferase 10 homolog C n=1 Tax=Sinocyclocheilus anshuiensis TaxID=1608454 RepID=UPI0007B9FEB8|nr:PREDICTED: mitochondrial ribonuclease P protein 1-like [Sinocyclocheilus anshuiensis]XP_016312330.1 PREDICTED: mitochondrial ribonuclease P protein 1-like [Sinocyclocheilus anshuiensis]XP_016312331.1 PREDICTED: mitochondrial ribonuclease P protein 1-like [Sinocyclocheilus anshuiensis]XP_016312332.1 PREDICTED: mitochondrial ribonuclease P protein 1-like [Sinocyclocheilus anshuiensis]